MARPRIGINAVFLDPGRTGGAETYTRELLRHLGHLPLDEDYVVFTPQPTDVMLTHPRIRQVVCPVDASRRAGRMAWEQFRLPGLLRRERLDLVHFPYGTMPLGYWGRSVVTIHDTFRFLFPGETPVVERWYKELNEHWAARVGHHLIAVSHDDAGRMQCALRVANDRIHVVYHGVGAEFRPGPAAAEHGAIVWVGRPYPRKNVAALIEAYARLGPTTVPRLQLIGIDRRDGERFRQLAMACGVADRVDVLPPRPHAELPELLRRARLFVYPSLYESFGIPVLEALACGVPVLCSDIAVFRELFGGAVDYANPRSIDHLAAQIDRALRDGRSAEQAEHARALAGRMTWRATAEATRAVYRRCIGQNLPQRTQSDAEERKDE